MRRSIDIVETVSAKDDEGFSAAADHIIATVRTIKDERHGSETWANMAAFATAVARFQFRKIPGVEVTTAHAILCDGVRYRIISVRDMRGIAVEVMVEKFEETVR